MMLRVLLVLGAILATASPLPGRTAEFDQGATAYLRGDFADALAIWQPLAEAGDARCQFNVGLLHERGQGVPQSDDEAARWYLRAANQGYAPAQHRLGQMLAEGRSAGADPVAAYFWLTLAERAHGAGGTSRWIAMQREAVRRKLSPEQLAEADAAILVWRPVRE